MEEDRPRKWWWNDRMMYPTASKTPMTSTGYSLRRLKMNSTKETTDILGAGCSFALPCLRNCVVRTRAKQLVYRLACDDQGLAGAIRHSKGYFLSRERNFARVLAPDLIVENVLPTANSNRLILKYPIGPCRRAALEPFNNGNHPDSI
jgi:hypothetical protein